MKTTGPIILGITLILAATLNVSAQSTNTVEACSTMLPEGFVYELTIKGTIDKDNMQGLTTGSISLTVSNDENATPVDDELGSRFGQCVYAFMK